MTQEESWSGWTPAQEQVWKINHGDWTKQRTGEFKREVRQYLVTSETVLAKMLFDFGEEGHRIEFEFEAFTRVKLREEHCWNA